MEEQDILQLWKTQDAKLEQSLAVNKKMLIELQAYKARSVLQSLKQQEGWGIAIAVIYLLLLGSLLSFAIVNYSSAANYFIISMGAIFLINIKGLIDYIKHLVWINNINFDGSIIEIQQKLNRLELSIIQHTRIMYLQFPFWTTFFLSDKWFPGETGWGLIVLQVALTSAFSFLAYWLYKNIRIENMNKKWFRRLIAGTGGNQVSKALTFYREIEDFKSDSILN
jgi:hypothetical protein